MLPFDRNITATLSLIELVLAVSALVALVLAVSLFIDYLLDYVIHDISSDEKLVAVIGLRNSGMLAVLNTLFLLAVSISGLTPPPVHLANQSALEASDAIFELMVLTMALVAGLNLRDRFRVRSRRTNCAGGHEEGRPTL